jgi:hypothetical protein
MLQWFNEVQHNNFEVFTVFHCPLLIITKQDMFQTSCLCRSVAGDSSKARRTMRSVGPSHVQGPGTANAMIPRAPLEDQLP